MKFSIPQKFRLSTLLYNKKFSLTLSLVLAFALWLGIAMTENPVRDRSFTDLSASISLENTVAAEMGLDFTSDVSSQKFTITVSGPNYIVSSLRPEDFSLTADTTNIISVGNQKLNIIPTSVKSGFTMTVSPSTIDVSVDKFEKDRAFAIAAEISGSSAAEGYRVDAATVIDSSDSKILEEIKISGPSTILNKIESVKAKAISTSPSNATEIFNSEIYIYGNDPDKEMYRFTPEGSIYDGNNNLINNSKLSLSHTNVKIVQTVVKLKTVKCKPVFENLPNNMKLEDIPYELSTDKVTIFGDAATIDNISEIQLLLPDLSKINIRDITKDTKSIVLKPSLPDGVEIDGVDELEFSIDFNFSDYAETTITVKKFKTANKESNLKASITTKAVTFKICGPRRIIRNIDANDFYASVDLKDKQAGSFKIDAVLSSDIYSNVWQVGTCPTVVAELS